MHFVDIEFIPFMLLPSLVLLYLVITNKSSIERIFDLEILRKLKLDLGINKRVRLLALFIALFFMILALARPVYDKGSVEVVSKRANLVIALDISRSMKAKDYFPNRLEFAKQKIKNLIKESKNLNIGLLTFGNGAYIVSPLTPDKEMLLYMLRKLDTDALFMKNSNFFAALEAAKLLFGKVKEKNLLIVTDGGDQRDFSNEISFAKRAGMKVFVLAVAGTKGVPIKENGDYLKDSNGAIHIFKLNPKIADLAHDTGGKFVEATLSSDDIKKIVESIQGYKIGKKERIIDRVELYYYLVFIALLFLFVSFFDIPTNKIAFVLPFVSMLAHGGILDFKHIKNAKEAYANAHFDRAIKEFSVVAKSKRNPQSYYDLANAYYKAGRYKEAIDYYKRVQTKDRKLEFKKLYNLGNSYFKLQNYQEAIKLYEKALSIKDDPDARYNLELAKKCSKNLRKTAPNNTKIRRKNKINKNLTDHQRIKSKNATTSSKKVRQKKDRLLSTHQLSKKKLLFQIEKRKSGAKV